MSSVSKSLLGAERVDEDDVGWKTMDSSTKAMKKHHFFGGDAGIVLATILTTVLRLFVISPARYYNQAMKIATVEECHSCLCHLQPILSEKEQNNYYERR